MAAAVRLALPQGSGLLGGNVARPDSVALDVFAAEFRADILGQQLQSALGGGVGGNGFAAHSAEDRGHVDDLAVTALDHAGQNGLCHNEGRREVHVHHPAEVLNRHLAHGNALDDAGVVHQNVQRSDCLFNVIDHFPDGSFIRNIADIGLDVTDAVGGIVLQRLVNGGLAGGVDDDPRTCAVKRLGDSIADAVAAAGNERGFPLQRELIHDSRILHNNSSL